MNLFFSRARPGALVLLLMLGACSTPQAPTTSAEAVGEIRPGSGFLNGYLDKSEWVDSLSLLPAPPETSSVLFQADQQAHEAGRQLRATARGKQAVLDAELRFPAAASHFSCALGVAISAEETPQLNMLLRRSLTDAGMATYAAKDAYQRERPFVAYDEQSCTPQADAHLAKNGSYPSAHAAEGWAWALILSEMAPERSDAILQRGLAFGQSRVICGAHWQSDVDAGRLIGAATVARLHAHAEFQAQFKAARTELQQARMHNAWVAVPSCQTETESMRSFP